MSSPEIYLLKGPMPNLAKMKKAELREECEMWRNIWNWVPSEVRYYVARVGQQVGITQRNYRRYLGILLDTHWDLLEIELGVFDKTYDAVEGVNYFEKKIVKLKAGSVMDFQLIKERKPEELVTGEITEPSAPSETPNAEEDTSENKPEDVNI